MTDSVTVIEPGGSIVVTQQGVNSLSVFQEAQPSVTVSEGGSSGGSGTLAGCSDVNLAGLVDGDLISFSASIGKWLATRKVALVDGGNF